MELYKVTQGSDWGNYYYLNKEKAMDKANEMNELIERFIKDGKNVDSRTYKVQSLETED